MTRITHSLQSISSRAERLAYFQVLFSDPLLAFHEASVYDSVTAADIQRVARQYLIDMQPNVVEYQVAAKKSKGDS
jgi:predicted Zn-dependent peptidase